MSKEDRDAFANVVANYVRARSLKGNGSSASLGGKPWSGKAGKYSDEYSTTKGRKSPVDLRLSGEMMKDLDDIKTKFKQSKYIVIGYEKASSELAGKVEGNRRGTYGQSAPIPGKARDFLKVSKGEVKELLKIYNKPKDEEAAELIDEGKKEAVAGVKIGNN